MSNSIGLPHKYTVFVRSPFIRCPRSLSSLSALRSCSCIVCRSARSTPLYFHQDADSPPPNIPTLPLKKNPAHPFASMSPLPPPRLPPHMPASHSSLCCSIMVMISSVVCVPNRWFKSALNCSRRICSLV